MRPLDLDLRRRVVAALEAGMTTAEAAKTFSVGKSTAGAWRRLFLKTGDVVPAAQGARKGSILDPYEGFILDLIEDRKDIALAEMADRLDAEYGLRPHPSTIWYFLDRRGITFKKRRRTPPSKSEKTSGSSARSGSKTNQTSIRAD